MSNRKIKERVVCPYCGVSEYYRFYYDEHMLTCRNCEREFAIRVEMDAEVLTSKIYDKQCMACGVYLYNEDLVDGSCPRCGCGLFSGNELKNSEFNVM